MLVKLNDITVFSCLRDTPLDTEMILYDNV